MYMSIFLAQFFSIYLLVMSLAVLFNTASFQARVHALVESEGALLIGSILALLLGTFLILVHSIWVYDWMLVITLLSWLVFLKGAVNILCPALRKRMMERMVNLRAYRILGSIWLIVALYLGYYGFWF